MVERCSAMATSTLLTLTKTCTFYISYVINDYRTKTINQIKGMSTINQLDNIVFTESSTVRFTWNTICKI